LLLGVILALGLLRRRRHTPSKPSGATRQR